LIPEQRKIARTRRRRVKTNDLPVDNMMTYLFGSRDFSVTHRITSGECTLCSNVRAGFTTQ
jgi:hypothetical protein